MNIKNLTISTKATVVSLTSFLVVYLGMFAFNVSVYAGSHLSHQQNTSLSDITNTFESFSNIVGILITAIFTLAIVFFFWKAAIYMFASDGASRTEARAGMLNGIIAVFVIASIWGIIALIEGATGTGGDTSRAVPGITTSANK